MFPSCPLQDRGVSLGVFWVARFISPTLAFDAGPGSFQPNQSLLTTAQAAVPLLSSESFTQPEYLLPWALGEE